MLSIKRKKYSQLVFCLVDELSDLCFVTSSELMVTHLNLARTSYKVLGLVLGRHVPRCMWRGRIAYCFYLNFNISDSRFSFEYMIENFAGKLRTMC